MKRRAEATATLAVLVLNSMATITTHASPSYVAPDISSVHIKSQGKTLYGRVFSPALQSAQSKAPAVFMLHGIPGTEQNFDVAYALRDAGFICLLWHYRGCWGSEGSYSIDGLPNDIEAAFRSVCTHTILFLLALSCPVLRLSPPPPCSVLFAMLHLVTSTRVLK